MTDRLDKFVQFLLERLGQHPDSTYDAVTAAKADLEAYDNERVTIEEQAYNDAHDNYGGETD